MGGKKIKAKAKLFTKAKGYAAGDTAEVNELNAELNSMYECWLVLSRIDKNARERVLCWLLDKTRDNEQSAVKYNAQVFSQLQSNVSRDLSVLTLHEALTYFRPKTMADKVLLAANWYFARKSLQDFTAAQVSLELKSAGERITNITRALLYLEQSTPRLIVSKKSGVSRQSQKIYSLTDAGKAKYQNKH